MERLLGRRVLLSQRSRHLLHTIMQLVRHNDHQLFYVGDILERRSGWETLLLVLMLAKALVGLR